MNLIKREYSNQLKTLDTKHYSINNYHIELENKDLGIEYHKNDIFMKKLLNHFLYTYLILKSKPKEVSINLKLYKSLKNSGCFDIGYYLRNNPCVLESKWIKYFHHYYIRYTMVLMKK